MYFQGEIDRIRFSGPTDDSKLIVHQLCHVERNLTSIGTLQGKERYGGGGGGENKEMNEFIDGKPESEENSSLDDSVSTTCRPQFRQDRGETSAKSQRSSWWGRVGVEHMDRSQFEADLD